METTHRELVQNFLGLGKCMDAMRTDMYLRDWKIY